MDYYIDNYIHYISLIPTPCIVLSKNFFTQSSTLVSGSHTPLTPPI